MKKIAWFVPFPLEGSGGNGNIFFNMNQLSLAGYECHAYVENKDGLYNDLEIRKVVESYFGTVIGEIYSGFDVRSDYDLIFATVWYSAKIVRDINTSAKKAYFIQDYEALFNPMGDGYLLAVNSYQYGLSPITIGKWLSHKMINEFNTQSRYFEFCADLSIYSRKQEIKKENAICFVYQPEKPRRCSVIGIEALGIVKHYIPDVKIYLFGSKEKPNLWFDYEHLPILSFSQLDELYNKCKVGICLSSSNPSRIPFEMMASGLPVVDLHMENNLYDYPDGGVLLAHHTPESIAESIMKLLKDEAYALEMSQFGSNYMQSRPLEKGYQQFLDSVKDIIEGNDYNIPEINRSYHGEPIVANSYEKYMVNPRVLTNYEKFKSTKLGRSLRKLKSKIK